MMAARILVVDDDNDVLELLRDALEPMGYEVTTSPDGADGLARWRAAPFDLLITDLLVPKLDGIRLAEEIRKQAPGAKILVLTAVARSLEAELRAAPIDDWIGKPVSVARLKSRVRELLGGE